MYYRKYLIALFTFISVAAHAQETDITGLWKGILYNDTTQMDYQYEIGISKEKGKYLGFSHTWFILDDKQYYGVKKVKIKIADDGKIIVEDDGLISNNYPVPPSKNVRQLNVLSLDASGPVMTLTGPFSTNRTKEYHSLTGSITLQRKNDFWQSALIPHLEELGKSSELSFVRIDKEEKNRLAVNTMAADDANNDRYKKQQVESSKADEISKKETVAKALAEEKAASMVLAKEKVEKQALEQQLKAEAATAKRELAAQLAAETAAAAAETAKATERKKEEEAQAKEAAVLAKQATDAKNAAEKASAKEAVAQQKMEVEKIKQARAIEKQEAEFVKKEESRKAALAKKAAAEAEQKYIQATAALAEKEAAIKKADTESAVATASNTKKPEENKNKVNSTLQKEEVNKQTSATTSIAAAAQVNERQTILQQTVGFSSDSLLLSLYDNGEVDGDTVSVLLNGTIILEKQGLSTVAIKKTIYIPANTDRMELVMYAESLGSIPPNTGLLVIRDGKKLYEVRFSGDLQKNASIVFNRKKE